MATGGGEIATTSPDQYLITLLHPTTVLILAFSSRDPRFFVYAWIFSDKFGFELNESFQEIEGNEEKISSCVFLTSCVHFSFALLEIRFKLLITMILISWLKYIGSRFKFPEIDEIDQLFSTI